MTPSHCVVLVISSLNAELNPICHLLALLGDHHILHVSGIGVKLLPEPIDTTMQLCRSYIQLYYLFRLYTSAIIRQTSLFLFFLRNDASLKMADVDNRNM